MKRLPFLTRRQFLKQTSAACAAASFTRSIWADEGLDFPLVDFHVHLDNSTIDQALALPQAQSIKFGVVEHAGTKENVYPVVLSNDIELTAYVKMLEGKPVYKGVQAEYTDWASGFTPAGLTQLDYVLIDAMTMPDHNGKRTKLWTKEAEIGEAQRFMDRYVDWHVEILSSGPVNILANVSWLPAALMPDYDRLWTEARMRKVIENAVRRGIALEISSSFKLPQMRFLRLAKAAGAKFTFGSNGRYPKMGLLDHSVRMAKELGLQRRDMFRPARQNFSSR
jgi:histidinol phosphatase-like PHP family hydrolase